MAQFPDLPLPEARVTTRVLRRISADELPQEEIEQRRERRRRLGFGQEVEATAVQKRPGALQMLSGLAKAGIAAGQRLRQGGRQMRTAAEQAEALRVCFACNHWDKQQSRCLKCGCFARFKVRLLAWDCPLGRWPKVDTVAGQNEAHNHPPQD